MFKILLLSLVAIFFLVRNRPQDLSLVLPLAKDNFVLSYNQKCTARISIEHKLDRLMSFNIIIRDLDSTQELFNSLLYFNPIGQLLASNTLVDNKSIASKGIKEINIDISGNNYRLKGPFLAELANDKVKFSYPNLAEFEKYYSIIKKLSIQEERTCNDYYKFEDLLKEFQNA